MARVTPIDVRWTGRPRSIAACLLESDGQATIIDPGPTSTLESLRAQLSARGISFGDLSAILLTHIHLDHAGAAGSIVRENPRLPVYVHTRGAPHLVDPSKLLSSAGRLYGNLMQFLYGDFLPVPEQNLRILSGGETLALGAQKLDVVYTPGHASHHVSFFDSTDGIAYVGDTAGIRIEGESFLLPATPPPDIHLELWDASLDAIVARRPAKLFLTHFGFSDEPAAHIAAYRDCLHRWSALVGELLRTHADEASGAKAFVETVGAEIRGALPSPEAEHYLFNGALELSWRGLARYWRKKSEASVSA